MEKTREALTEVLQDVFGSDVQVSDSLKAAEVEGWDSLNHIRLMVSIEKKFKISLNPDEFNELKNVGEMLRMIEKKRLSN